MALPLLQPPRRVPSPARHAPFAVRVRKDWPTLGLAMEGGANTQQPNPRIIAIQPNGAAFHTDGLRVGQLIKEVDGVRLTGDILVC